jgi:hypothetical protein
MKELAVVGLSKDENAFSLLRFGKADLNSKAAPRARTSKPHDGTAQTTKAAT